MRHIRTLHNNGLPDGEGAEGAEGLGEEGDGEGMQDDPDSNGRTDDDME